MRNKKICLFIIIVFTIVFSMISVLLINNSVEAKEFPVFAHEGYNKLSTYGVTSLDSTSWSDGDRYWCSQSMCIEKQSSDTDGPLYIYAIIDINPDGNNPTYAEITYRTSSSSGTTTTAKDTIDDYDMARLAYIAAKAEINHANCSSHTDDTKSVSWNYKKSFLYLWEKAGLRSTLNALDNRLSLPTSTDKGEKVSAFNKATDYADSVIAGTNEVTYTARVIVFKGGWIQTTAILSGKEADPSKPTDPNINKYISSVTLPTGDSLDVGDRSGYSESKKLSNPVTVMPGSIVTYTIEIGGDAGTDNEGFYVEDTYDDDYLSYYSGNTYRWSHVGDSYTVRLKVDDDTPSSNTKYENNAKIVEYGEDSSDYVKVVYEEEEETITHETSGNYKKYIVKHNGQSVSGRDGYSNDTAKKNPVTVKKGDTVTFRLLVENTSNYDIVDLRVKDTLQNGLEYNGSSGTKTFTIGDIDAGDEKYIDITVDVTKSDMYLLPIENKFEIYDGKYIDYETVDVYMWFMGVRYYLYSYEVEVKKDISTSWFSSNANKDYVQLDDPEIAGNVWIDKDGDGLKESGESNLSGITVKLYKNGTLYGTKTTNSSGYYTFGKVPKGNVAYSGGTRKYADNSGYNSYYVEFTYDGVRYEDTKFTDATGVTDTGTNSNWNSKSHAQELTRDAFNKSLETIAYNKAYAGPNGTESQKALEYDKSGHTSTLKTNASTLINAKSIDLFVQVGSTTTLNTVYADHVEYLKHINLGLITKEQGDLSLKKDVISAVVTVNGYTSTYNYGKYGTGSYTGSYKLATPYVLTLYRGDYDFRSSAYPTGLKSSSDDLQITLTYRVTLKNESSKYTSVVREVIDISSNSLTLQSVSKGTAGTSSSYNSGTSYSYSGYQTHYIKLNESLAPNASTTFDLVYTVNKNSGAIILGEKANIAQIGAYSIYLNSQPAGVVDNDSNPGIVNPSVISNITKDTLYEDHCFYTSIVIKDTPPNTTDKLRRKITGNVWEDLNTSPATTIGQKTGDGKKLGSEKGAQNVTVVLLEVVRKDGKEYLIDTGLKTKTDTNGNYTLVTSSGTDRIHAGEYVVRFIYGNTAADFVTTTGDTIKYSGQDYKSTTYTPVGNASNETEVVDATAFATLKTSKGAQVSVARDDEIRRLEVIDYSTQMTYKLDSVLKAHDSNTLKQELANNTSMFADTKVFNVQIEKTNSTGVTVNTTVSESADGTKTYTYTIGEVNFGLIERPITKLELMDDIKEITAVTASGEEILHIYFDIAYKYNSTTKRVESDVTLNEVLSKGHENVQMLDRTSTTKGFRYVNIDSDLLQGMKVTIKYQFAIANIGDIDTSNENLIKMVEDYKVGDVVAKLNTSDINVRYKLGSGSGVDSKLLKNTTFTNVKNAVNGVKTSYSNYKTMVNGSLNNSDYALGYFLGNKYYGAYNATTDKVVTTRVDQIVSYVDNDLIFAPEDNVTATGSPKFQTYTGTDIEKYALLKGVTAANISQALVDKNGVSYVTNTKNNLAFNIESSDVNPTLYKYLEPIKSGTTIAEDKLYTIQLTASRVLASQLDLEDVVLDNLTEIVKISNTVGRKAYIEFIDTQTGNIITPGPSGPTGYLGNTPDFIQDPDDKTVGQKEIDTNFTETVTFSPPTGLSQKAQTARTISTTVIVVLIGIVVLAAGGTVAFLIGRKKVYK